MSDHALPLRLVGEDPLPTPRTGSHVSSRTGGSPTSSTRCSPSRASTRCSTASRTRSRELVPHDSLTIYEADEPRRLLIPVWARDKWADKILAYRVRSAKG